MTHQQMEIKIKELEKRIDALNIKIMEIVQEQNHATKVCGIANKSHRRVRKHDKIRSEIERQEKWLLRAGCTAYNVDIALDAIKSAVGRSDVD